MLNKIQLFKISTLLLIVLMATTACDVFGSLDISVEESVALTVAASNVQPTLSVDEIVALTVAASAPADTATENPKSGSDTDAAPAAADATTVGPYITIDSVDNAVANQPQLRANQNANVRKGPGTSFGTASSLQLNAVANVVAKNRDESWYLIDIPGSSNKGWIANSVTDPVFPEVMGSVPVAATIPAPPTSTPMPTATATATTAATATTHSGGHTPTPHGGHTPTHTPTPAVTLISPTAVPSSIEVYNNSGTYICYVLTAASGENYGSNHLNGELAPGNSLYIIYPDAGPYELYAQECEGYDDLYWATYNIFNDYTWELIPGGDEG